MLRYVWWLLGERRVFATHLAQYRRAGALVAVAGVCYRITRVDGLDVWGRRVNVACDAAQVLVVESPLKHLRKVKAQTRSAASLKS